MSFVSRVLLSGAIAYYSYRMVDVIMEHFKWKREADDGDPPYMMRFNSFEELARYLMNHSTTNTTTTPSIHDMQTIDLSDELI